MFSHKCECYHHSAHMRTNKQNMYKHSRTSTGTQAPSNTSRALRYLEGDLLVGCVGEFEGGSGLSGGGQSEPEGVRRSEEHTSELQSLMRISYAVFCLKKKKKI